MAAPSDSSPTGSTPIAAQSATQTLDLEKELSCSICTDILYQPLTLLDCLHTFCGSCLKEWFSWQGKAVERLRSNPASPPFTCPSCRAAVRDTKPNATVTTLLDMYMQANPAKSKTEEERQDIASKYKPGEKIIPTPRASQQESRRQRRQQAEEEADQRLLQAVSELSVRRTLRPRDRSATSRDEHSTSRDGRGEARSRTRRSRDASQTPHTDEVSPHRAAREELERQLRTRQRLRPGQSLRSLEHQASLRTLMSASRTDPAVSQAVQDDVLRQIMDEGLLDNIDLSSLNVHDEEVISEIIAQAYLSRRNRSRTPSGRDQTQSGGVSAGIAERPTREAPQRAPPVSRPHLLETPRDVRSRRRSSSQGSSRSIEVSGPSRSSTEAVNGVVGSQVTETSHNRRLMRTSNDISRPVSMENRRLSTESRTRSDQANTTASRSAASEGHIPQHTSPTAISPPAMPAVITTPPHTNRGTSESRARQTSVGRQPITLAPIVSCSNCKRSNIQYGLHYICRRCVSDDGASNVPLCQRCYLSGVGCKYWYGFGWAAAHKFAQMAPPGGYPPDISPPHIMRAERWVSVAEADRAMRGASKLQSGLFCSACQKSSNACYWRCNECNDGEWGYCNSCVNQARHCTHSLLPIGVEDVDNVPGSADAPEDLEKHLVALPVHTTCDHCQNPIPPSSTRYHCPTCNDGDYDICNLCYRGLVSAGNISEADGPRGWRKCVKGHRMLVVGFDSRPEGQRRVVVEAIVGGWRTPNDEAVSANQDRLPDAGFTWHDPKSGSWKHKRDSSQSVAVQRQSMSHASAEHSPRLFPAPDYGVKMVALWTRLPDEGVDDELTFPKHAEITEVLSINENWCWGVYSRKGGMFPAAYCRPS